VVALVVVALVVVALVVVALVVVALVAFIFAYPDLAEQAPVHLNIQNNLNGYGSRFSLLLLGPGILLVETAKFSPLPRSSLDGINFIRSAEKTYILFCYGF
jgi:hypothetical protein